MQLRRIQQTEVAEPVLDELKEQLFYALLERGIKTDDELHFFIWAYLGYNVPRNQVCAGHCSPFSFIADQFFDRHQTVIGFANRNGGKTLGVALLNAVELLAKPGIEIFTAGAVESQALRGYEYVSQFLTSTALVESQVMQLLRSKTILRNGSKLEVAPGTVAKFNGPHTNKTRIDEIELLHWFVLQQAMSISTEKNGWPAGDCFTSTRKISNGTMQRLLDQAEEKGFKVYTWCVYEILEPCTRLCKGDPVYGDCPVYSRKNKDGEEVMLCGGKAHDLKPGGFYKIADFVKKASTIDEETWETEWLNLRPSAGATVYGKYYKDEAPFIVSVEEAAELLARAKKDKWQRGVAIDFGSNFYAGYFMQDPLDQVWYQYQEYFYSSDNDLPLSEHAKNIKERDVLGWDGRIYVFADPSGRQAIRDLEDYGIFAVGANNDLYAGLNRVKKEMQRRTAKGLPGIRFFPHCGRIRLELEKLYMNKMDRDGTPQRDIIVKKDDHGSDTLRYWLISYETVGTGRYRMRKLRGVN